MVGNYCERKGPSELLPRADLIAFLLMNNESITGVAIAGSLAMMLQRVVCHDIDFVLLHNGELEDGLCSEPETARTDCDEWITMSSFATSEVARRLTQARLGVPVDFLCVNQKILWDCEYLRSRGRREEFKDFYLQIFSAPLILLNPFHRRGDLFKHTKEHEIVRLERMVSVFDGLSYPGIRIKHTCPGMETEQICEGSYCLPEQSWKKCREEIRKRKNHHWHD